MFRYIVAFCLIVIFRGGFTLAANTQADTDCGKVKGVQAGNALEFRGIPYAEPPVGNLRWRKPVAISPENGNCWNGVLKADEFASVCYQWDFITAGQYEGSEDCLYLNVWTPDINPSTLKNVMVFIHGGCLTYGNGNWHNVGLAPTANLSLELDTVFVSFNYRLHAMGFLALECLKDNATGNTSGNYGFMDMLEALRWVKRNIENFGGDPNKVTVFGHSSGGTALLGLLGSPLSTGLFQKAWMLSASPLFDKSAEDAFADNEVFLTNTGCSNATCLRELSAHDLTSSVPWFNYPMWLVVDLLGLPKKDVFYGALAIVDGYVLKKPPFEAIADHDGPDVPLMIGTNAQEVGFYPIPRNLSSWSSADYEGYVRNMLGEFSDLIAEVALGLYPADAGTPELMYTTMTSDLRVICGTDYFASIVAATFTSSVYRYVTTYYPSQPSYYYGYDFLASYSGHGMDLFAFFGTMDVLVSPPAEADLQWQSHVQKEIMAFVRDARPNTTTWENYPMSAALLSTNTTSVCAYHPSECLFWLKNDFFKYSWIN